MQIQNLTCCLKKLTKLQLHHLRSTFSANFNIIPAAVIFFPNPTARKYFILATNYIAFNCFLGNIREELAIWEDVGAVVCHLA